MNEALPYKFWGIEGGEIPVPPFPMKHRYERWWDGQEANISSGSRRGSEGSMEPPFQG